jgi:hypothetical protein
MARQELETTDTLNAGRLKMNSNFTELYYKRKVFNIKEYGALGDGKWIHDISMSNGSSTLTSASANFTAGDVGKIIKVYRGVTSNGCLVGTITGYTNSTTITVSTTNSSGSNITTGRALYGTDDQDAIRDAVYAADDAGGGDVLVPIGKFLVGGAPQSTITWNAVSYNADCIIGIPFRNAGTDYARNHIRIIGECRPNFTMSAYLSGTGARPYLEGGSQIISTYSGTGIARSGIFGFLHPGTDFNYNYASFKNLTLLADAGLDHNGAGVGGINARYGPSLIAEWCLYGIDEMIHTSVQPLNNVIGFESPDNSSETMNQVRNCFAYGCNWGFRVGEHTVLDHAQAFGCGNGFAFKDGSHAILGLRLMTVGCINQINILATYAGGASFIIDVLDVEALTVAGGHTGKWYLFGNGFVDGVNYGAGKLNYMVVESNVGKNNALWTKVGGSGVTATAF